MNWARCLTEYMVGNNKITGIDNEKSIPGGNTRSYGRDVTTGATGATEIAPKFSDTLTLS